MDPMRYGKWLFSGPQPNPVDFFSREILGILRFIASFILCFWFQFLHHKIHVSFNHWRATIGGPGKDGPSYDRYK